MASVFGHAAFSYGVSRVFPKSLMSRRVVFLGIVSSMLPDLDVISTYFGIWGLGMYSHRGLTHSLFFALLWSVVLILFFHRSLISKEKLQLGLFYYIATASHGLLDAMTNGGDGIAFFAPFSSERYFLPLRMIEVSPLGIKSFFSTWGLQVLGSELIFIGIPTLLLIMAGKWLNK